MKLTQIVRSAFFSLFMSESLRFLVNQFQKQEEQQPPEKKKDLHKKNEKTVYFYDCFSNDYCYSFYGNYDKKH